MKKATKKATSKTVSSSASNTSAIPSVTTTSLETIKEKFDVAHGMAAQEDTRINNRLTWLLVTQAMLLAGIGAFFTFPNRLHGAPKHLFVVAAATLIALLGVYLPLIVWQVVVEAFSRKDAIDKYWKKSDLNAPRELRRRRKAPWWGGQEKIPFIFGLAWISILCAFICVAYFSDPPSENAQEQVAVDSKTLRISVGKYKRVTITNTIRGMVIELSEQQ